MHVLCMWSCRPYCCGWSGITTPTIIKHQYLFSAANGIYCLLTIYLIATVVDLPHANLKNLVKYHKFFSSYRNIHTRICTSSFEQQSKSNAERPWHEMYMLMVNLTHWVSTLILQCDSPVLSIVRFTCSVENRGKLGTILLGMELDW